MAAAGHGRAPRSASTRSLRVAAWRTSPAPAKAASAATSAATTTPRGRTASASAMTPGTPRSEPSSPSSPQNARPRTANDGSDSDATSTPMAMGRSSPAPPFRTPDGARLTVVLRWGQGRPLDSNAARTRSRDSRTAASGRPTMVNPGSPFDTCTSTDTGRPSTPNTTADGMAAIMAPPASVDGPGEDGTAFCQWRGRCLTPVGCRPARSTIPKATTWLSQATGTGRLVRGHHWWADLEFGRNVSNYRQKGEFADGYVQLHRPTRMGTDVRANKRICDLTYVYRATDPANLGCGPAPHSTVNGR